MNPALIHAQSKRILPFRGVLYNPLKVAGDDVVAPPYDIITPEHKALLYEKSPFNIVRVDFGKDFPDDGPADNRYTRARAYMDQWLGASVLVSDDSPCFYGYEVEYRVRGRLETLRGVVALVRVDELGHGVYPHEATHSKPKADRLSIMQSCSGNISPIYSLYHSAERKTSGVLESLKGAPYISARDSDGSVHTLRKITDEKHIDEIQRELSGLPIYIADGHHRYEVALQYMHDMDRLTAGAEPGAARPWNYVMMFLANMADRGITILPTHRLFKGLSGSDQILPRLSADFAISEQDAAGDVTVALSAGGRNTFGLYLRGNDKWYLLKYRGDKLDTVPPALRDLDVVVLHELIIRRDLALNEVSYEMDVGEALKKVREGAFEGVFFLNPTQAVDVERVALANLRMPPKSTYFFPKLLTGLVINSFNNF